MNDPDEKAKQDAADAAVLRESRKHTRRSFVMAAAGNDKTNHRIRIRFGESRRDR